MITIDDALGRLARAVAPLDSVELDFREARRLVLAEPVEADRDHPPTDRSAMDGFAVRSADLAVPGTELRVVGQLRAGEPAGDLRVEPRAAVRIFTGAVIPDGADAVVMVEDCTEDRASDRVAVAVVARVGQHIRRQGSDRRAGEVILRSGDALRAAEIAALASVGRTRVRIVRPPEVGVLSTGDELVDPRERPAPYQIRNSNTPMLLAQLEELGVRGEDLGGAGDSVADLAAVLERGLEADLLLITGGVSVGEYDLVDRVLAEAGMELLFHRVAMKPGKPILAGRRGGCLVIGLPGNPVSAFCGFAVFVAPMLRKMLGHHDWKNRFQTVRLDEAIRCRPGRTTFHLARIESTPEGPHGRRIEATGSGDLLALPGANGFLITPADMSEAPEGELLEALPWRESGRC